MLGEVSALALSRHVWLGEERGSRKGYVIKAGEISYTKILILL